MSYLTRAKALIQSVRRHNAPVTSNAALVEFGQAVLYHHSTRSIWSSILAQRGWVINPDNLAVLDDVGTPSVLDNPETPEDESIPFTPASNSDINDAIASLFIRFVRQEFKLWLRDYRLNTTAPTGLTLEASRSEIIASADSDATVIVGDDTDDPDN